MIAPVSRGAQPSCEALSRFVQNQSILLVTGDTSYEKCGAKKMLAEPLDNAVTCQHISHVGDLLTLEELDA